jgi:hypothetical protein
MPSENKIEKKISGIIDRLEKYNQLRTLPRSDSDFRFIRDFFPRFIEDQKQRADEIDSPEYQNALALAKAQFPHKPHSVVCVDGRVLLFLIYGGIADIDDSIRVPGGMLREFIRGKDGHFLLRSGSNYAKLLEKAIEQSDDGCILQIFDSHIGCAARKAEEAGKGKYPGDSGLLADVRHKRQMVEAAVRYVKDHYGTKKRIIPIQISFNPHTGYLFMGLETNRAYDYAVEHEGEFNDEIIKQLVDYNLIISTEALVHEAAIRKILEKYDFDLSWTEGYIKSATEFWKGVSQLKHELAPIIEEKLVAIYPSLRDTSREVQEELQSRMILIIANMYSGFLENKHPQIQDTAHNHAVNQDQDHAYSYGVHEEEGVRVGEGGFPPYKISMFGVFSLDSNTLPANIQLAASLVRGNRKDGRVKDRSGTFTDPDEFAQAPIPVILREVTRDARLTKEEWRSFENIDWSDLMDLEWDMMTEEEFENYIEAKAKLPQSIANSLKRLRHRMMILYDPNQAISHNVTNQDFIVLPVVSDRSRRIWSVIPFVKLGYKV